jgi:23S rRNA (pseudouridine1915-N3)-methyltransferase
MSAHIGRITVVAVGKIRTPYWQEAQRDYAGRLTRYTAFDLIETKDVVGRGRPDEAAMQKEGELLLAGASPVNRLILLSAEGQSFSSPGLARFVQKQIELYSHLGFLIGGPLGFSDDVRAAAHDTLSLSPMTFPHELARVMLLEQLYRAFTILRGEPYHK